MKRIITTICIALALLGLASLAFAAPAAINLDKATVEIGTFYNGTTVVATGEVPAGSEAIVRVSGKPQEIHLKKKGKAAGFIWMNTGDLIFENAPRIYMLYSSGAGEKYLSDTKLGFSLPALENRVEIKPEGEDKAFFFKEFLKLKKKESVYAEFPGKLTYTGENQGARQFQVTLKIPPRMSEGDYSIDIFAVKGDQLVGTAAKNLEVKMVGFPKQLSNLAFHNGTLFGTLSVLIAVAAGLVMGMLFKGKGGAH